MLVRLSVAPPTRHSTTLDRSYQENDVVSAEGWVSPAAGCRVLAALCARQGLVSAGHPEDKIVKAGTREQSQGTARLEILQLLNMLQESTHLKTK